MNVVEFIAKHEGLRLKPYIDTVGKTSIGYGRNLYDNGISETEARFMLLNDIDTAQKDLDTFTFSGHLNRPRRAALLSMIFNLGLPRFSKFRMMIAALEAKNWDAAAREALDSQWAKQVGKRAEEIAEIIRTGKFANSP